VSDLPRGPGAEGRPGRSLLAASLGISLLTLCTQVLRLVVQMIIARNFGAGSQYDAFLTANTLPTYASNLWLSTVNAVIVPIFISISAQDGEREAFAVLAWVALGSSLLFAAVGACVSIFAAPLLGVMTPGLERSTLLLASSMSGMVWLAAVLTAAFSVVSAGAQAQRRYSLTVIGPLVGTALQVVILAAGRRLGPQALTVSFVGCTALQLAAFLPFLRGKLGRFSLRRFPARRMLEIARLAGPLVVIGIFARFPPLVERFLASSGDEGSISRLNYAGRAVQIIALLVSSGLATVIFTRLSEHAAQQDRQRLAEEFNRGVRLVYLAVVPFVALGIGLAEPGLGLLFQRGSFTARDTALVAGYFRLYAPACIGMCLGSITGKVFYVERRTGFLALMTAAEIAVFAGYSVLLTRAMGVAGIALSYTIYYNLSILWHLAYAAHRLGRGALKGVAASLARTTAGGLACLAASALVGRLVQWRLGSCLAGAAAGVGACVLVLLLLRSSELKALVRMRGPGRG
jgi:putative peptidoglycan lipid II flippase